MLVVEIAEKQCVLASATFSWCFRVSLNWFMVEKNSLRFFFCLFFNSENFHISCSLELNVEICSLGILYFLNSYILVSSAALWFLLLLHLSSVVLVLCHCDQNTGRHSLKEEAVGSFNSSQFQGNSVCCDRECRWGSCHCHDERRSRERTKSQARYGLQKCIHSVTFGNLDPPPKDSIVSPNSATT